MSVAAMPIYRGRSTSVRVFQSAFLVWFLDGLFAIALGILVRGVTFERVWQGVGSVLLGKDAYQGGMQSAAIGLVMHLAVASAWSIVFMLAVQRSPRLRAILDSPYGTLKVGAIYGPFIWLLMSLVVIPALVHRPPVIGPMYWVQLIGHIPFVGLPIAATIGTPSR